VQIRRERPEDVPAIDEVHRQAFAVDHRTAHRGGGSGRGDLPPADPLEVALVHGLRSDPGWVPALSLVAVDACGAVVGHVVATEGHLGDATAVGIGPLGVLPAWQGRGVGRALVHAVVAAADALGYPLAVLLGDPRFYGHLGFVTASTLGIEAPDPAWGLHFQARPLAAYWPGLRGTFRYAVPFEVA
jgi:putative acetyltransferase